MFLYRRFIERFAEIPRPLINLLKTKTIWHWAPTEKEAFEKFKLALTTAPALQQNDENKAYILRTDASAYALGAVLLQGEGEDVHPIEYTRCLLRLQKRITARRNAKL